MQKGIIIEQGATAEGFGAPQHGYTKMLLDSIRGRRWTPPGIGSLSPDRKAASS